MAGPSEHDDSAARDIRVRLADARRALAPQGATAPLTEPAVQLRGFSSQPPGAHDERPDSLS